MKLVRAVQIDRKVYLPGQEKEVEKLLSLAQLRKLAAKGHIEFPVVEKTGFKQEVIQAENAEPKAPRRKARTRKKATAVKK